MPFVAEAPQRQVGLETRVTPEMIEAGVAELREKMFGQPLAMIVEDIYWAMKSVEPAQTRGT